MSDPAGRVDAGAVAGPVGALIKGWVPPPFPTRETLFGRYAILEPLALDHAAGLHAANLEDPAGAIWTYLPYGPFDTRDAYAAWVREVARQPDPLFYAVTVDGAPLGVVSYLRIAPAAGSIEIGHICFSPRLQRTPAATEAFVLLAGWAFEAGYRRLEWKCDALNAPSRRAARRFGLSYEGVFRQATISKGRNRDTAWYAAIDSEWPRLRAAYDAWLDPANFDAEHRQLTRLSALTHPILAAEG
ncbi:MAG: GNAT family N-acetyltransferase [Paracoccaceae bacterium]